jgi:thiosulfate/3-mercaptopyruvate sulfurtransferase
MPSEPLGPPIVSASWLADHLDDVVVADVRWYLDGRSGRAAYDGGHLPGAIWIDLDGVLADPADPLRGRHPLPSPERFAAALGALGIGADRQVVAYDDAGGASAARLVWLLRRIGQPAALLDGGLTSWSGPLSTEAPSRASVARAPRPWPPDAIVDADRAATAPVLLDARAAERYRGEVEPVDPRAGHIPGARSMPLGDNLDADGRFRPPGVLRERFATAGVHTDGPTAVVYCGSGVTACHVLLALEAAGLPGRLYAGSWSQWSNDPSRPAVTGPDPR